MGEVLAAIPLIEEVRRRTPKTPVFISTTTLAGRETATKRLAGLSDGVFFAPFDFVWVVRRVLRRLRPSVVVILETEIWPNLFREAKRIGCGLALVNGRISDRALPRYRTFAPFFSPVLSLCDRILVQSEEMRARFVTAGAAPNIVQAGGNLKYDFAPAAIAPDSPVLRFLEADPRKPLWIAASTSADDHSRGRGFRDRRAANSARVAFDCGAAEAGAIRRSRTQTGAIRLAVDAPQRARQMPRQTFFCSIQSAS